RNTEEGMSRKVAVLSLAAAITLGLAGVAPAASAKAQKTFTMGYSVGFLTDPFQAIEVDLTLAAAHKAGLKTLPVTNANGDAAKQITDFHNLVAEGAQGIITVPTDSDAIVPAISYASSKHVPVVAIDIGPSGGHAAMIVRADNVRMGEDACQVIGKQLDGKGIVLSMMGDQATTNGRDRTVGFADCMKKNYPGIKLIQRPTYWKPATAAAVAQTVVTATPKLAAIYMQSDSVMLPGVVNALKTADRLTKVGAPHHIMLVSIDGTPLALKDIRAGLVDDVISQPLNLYVKYGVYYLIQAMEGHSFQVGPTDHDSHIVAFKGSFMDLLPAPVVTRANVDDPSLWGNHVKE
ncbi:MAG: sugar ABC transporter substrate-binding protein, partial [Acetobacteraceae bacterium]